MNEHISQMLTRDLSHITVFWFHFDIHANFNIKLKTDKFDLGWTCHVEYLIAVGEIADYLIIKYIN